MTQFNLLPDVKLEYIKTRRVQGLVILSSTIVTIISLGVFIIMFAYVKVIQKNHINNLSNQISSSSGQLSSNANLNKILTIQNQLLALPTLHNAKPSTEQILPFINQVTPATATISSLSLDFKTNSATAQGNADSIATVNTFVDTLKFTDYFEANNTTTHNAFSNVVLSGFSNNSSSPGVTFDIAFSFDPAIFTNSSQVLLSVPKIITTRSITQQPTNLFLGKTTGGQ